MLDTVGTTKNSLSWSFFGNEQQPHAMGASIRDGEPVAFAGKGFFFVDDEEEEAPGTIQQQHMPGSLQPSMMRPRPVSMVDVSFVKSSTWIPMRATDQSIVGCKTIPNGYVMISLFCFPSAMRYLIVAATTFLRRQPRHRCSRS